MDEWNEGGACDFVIAISGMVWSILIPANFSALFLSQERYYMAAVSIIFVMVGHLLSLWVLCPNSGLDFLGGTLSAGLVAIVIAHLWVKVKARMS